MRNLLNKINKIVKIFDSEDRFKILFLFMLNILTSIFELLGIASILPFIGLISNPDFFSEYTFFVEIFEKYNLTQKELIISTGIFIIILFILSNITSAYNLWKTMQFTAYQSHKISCEMMKTYIYQPYYRFINFDISMISKNVLSESSLLSENFLMPLLQVVTKSTILLSISLLLVYINSIAFIYSLFFLLILYFTIYRKIRLLITKYGKNRLVANDSRFKHVNEAFKSIKDIKFYNVEDFYLKGFSKSQNDFLLLTIKNTLFGVLPKYFIEIVAIGSIFSIILFLIINDSNLVIYLPTISVFIVAAYRILPLIQQIFVNITSMKFYAPTTDVLEKIRELTIDDTITEKQKISFNERIAFEGISFSHQNKSIINNISFSIKKGSVNAIIGKSGVGKTTILDLLLGFLFPKSGKITVDNAVLSKDNYKQLRNISGYVSQNVSFIDNSVINNIILGKSADNINIKSVENLLKCVELFETVQSMSNSIYTSIGEAGNKLSGGQRQRLGIARALYRSPELLILDEATNAIDFHTEEKIINNIKKYFPNITIIIITHRLSSAMHYNNILVLQESKIHSLEKEQMNSDFISELIK
tara:strand:- start:4123 stop:5889 length:1767 start_codon:yes stop_codon:yes gene_type:complete